MAVNFKNEFCVSVCWVAFNIEALFLTHLAGCLIPTRPPSLLLENRKPQAVNLILFSSGAKVGVAGEWAGRNGAGAGGTGFTSRYSHSPLETDVPLLQLTFEQGFQSFWPF